MILPPAIAASLVERFGSAIETVTPVSGGMIHQAARITMPDQTFFLKWGSETIFPYEVEADGLERLQTPQTFRIPQVLAVGDSASPFLALEWLVATLPGDADGFGKQLGERLAALHRTTTREDRRFGLDIDNVIGPLPQTNRWSSSWSEFYRDQRLLPQITALQKKKDLTPEREKLLFTVCDRLPVLLDDMSDPPALLHGDLWSGNFICTHEDVPAVYDPAVYYGPREIEMAYTELFGGFPSGFLAAYESAYPLDPGYSRRRSVHQLYPLLIHYLLFGEPYGAQVEAVCRKLCIGA